MTINKRNITIFDPVVSSEDVLKIMDSFGIIEDYGFGFMSTNWQRLNEAAKVFLSSKYYDEWKRYDDKNNRRNATLFIITKFLDHTKYSFESIEDINIMPAINIMFDLYVWRGCSLSALEEISSVYVVWDTTYNLKNNEAFCRAFDILSEVFTNAMKRGEEISITEKDGHLYEFRKFVQIILEIYRVIADDVDYEVVSELEDIVIRYDKYKET